MALKKPYVAKEPILSDFKQYNSKQIIQTFWSLFYKMVGFGPLQNPAETISEHLGTWPYAAKQVVRTDLVMQKWLKTIVLILEARNRGLLRA